MLKAILGKIIKPKPVGVTCIRCGWNGTREQLMKSPRLNEDGKQYQIDTCPQCLRNGGLDYHN